MTTLATWQAAHADLPRLERDLLLGRALGLSRAQVIAQRDRPLSAGELDRVGRDAARLRAGEPLAYVLGEREFWGLPLDVGPAVLVPRPETELLVERALALVPDDGGRCDVLELGTGSGAIAIALATELRGTTHVSITATDLSADALAVARRNGARHGVAVRWIQGSWYDAAPGRYHLIVSNPPYVRSDDPHLASLTFEPALALVGGAGGLDSLAAVVRGAPAHLRPGGWLVLEHGWDQGSAVRGLLAAAGFESLTTDRDLSGHERATSGRWPVGEDDGHE
jgi:release factor glutamine methyltransferase